MRNTENLSFKTRIEVALAKVLCKFSWYNSEGEWGVFLLTLLNQFLISAPKH